MRVAPAQLRPPSRHALAGRALLLASVFAFAFASASSLRAAPRAVVAARTAQTPAAQVRPGAQRPAGLSEYRARVREAVAPLEDLAAFYDRVRESEKPEVWSKQGFNSDFVLELPKREEAAFGKVRGLLPPKERVEWGGSFMEADNSWLHSALDEASMTDGYDKRAAAVRAAAGRLRALEAQLAEAEAEAAPLDRDAERGRLNAILRDPAFNRETRQQGGAFQRLLDEFLEWLRSLLGRTGPVAPGASPRASKLAQVFVLGLCLAVVVYVARRLWLRRSRELRTLKLKRGARVILGERLEADKTAADLLEDAERLARAGDLRGAIRKAYVALLCELGDRGVIGLAQHRTNRDYLEAVRRAAPPRLYTEMLPLTFDFELHWYGLQNASDADWESFRTRCRQALRGV